MGRIESPHVPGAKMESRYRWIAIGIIALYLLAGLGVLAAAWLQTGRLDQAPVLVMSGLALIAAVVMVALLAMMPDPRGMVFFGVFFGLVVLPHFIAFGLMPEQLLRSDPPAATVTVAAAPPAAEPPLQTTDLTRGIRDARQATLAVYGDGSQVLEIRYDSAALARLRYLAEYQNQPPPLATLADHAGVLTEEQGFASFQYPDDSRLMRVTAVDRAVVERRLLALRQAEAATAVAAAAATAPKAVPPPAALTLEERYGLPLLLALLLAYVLFVSWVFLRLASWAASYPPPPGVAPQSADELRERLLALDRAGLPFTLRLERRHDELIAEWRYADATWLDLMRAHRLRYLIRYRLRLDETTHRVRVLEYRAAFDASAGTGGATLHFRAQRGITFFERRVEGVLGLQIRDGRLTRDLAYVYRFDVDEMRGPLVKLVNDAGWEWRQLMLDAKWLSG